MHATPHVGTAYLRLAIRVAQVSVLVVLHCVRLLQNPSSGGGILGGDLMVCFQCAQVVLCRIRLLRRSRRWWRFWRKAVG